jgi:hypothetical protein
MLPALLPRRRMRTLVIANAETQGRLAAPLARAGIHRLDGTLNTLVRRALRHGFAHTVVIHFPSADPRAIATVNAEAPELPALLIGEQERLPIDTSRRPFLTLSDPVDPRVLVAALYTLLQGSRDVDTTPVTFDDRLSYIASCGLIFCNNGLLPLHIAERITFLAMLREPDRDYIVTVHGRGPTLAMGRRWQPPELR